MKKSLQECDSCFEEKQHYYYYLVLFFHKKPEYWEAGNFIRKKQQYSLPVCRKWQKIPKKMVFW